METIEYLPTATAEDDGAVRSRRSKSATFAARALAITVLSIVLSEIVAMGAIRAFRLSSFLATTALDVLIMITLGFPVLYALTFRPLVLLAASRQRAKEALEATNRELEVVNRAERKARDAAETMRSAALAMTRPVDTAEVVAALLDHLGRLVPFERARVILGEKNSRLRTVALARPGRGIEFPTASAPFDASIDPVLRELLASGRGAIIADTHLHPVWGPHMRPEFEHSWMGVPLIAAGKTIGLYSLARAEPGVFDAGHLQAAEALSGAAAVAIHNAELFEQLLTERERLQALSRKLVDLQESERRAVARELHDEAGQTLTSLKIGLRLLEQGSTDPEVVSRAADLRRVAEDAQEGLHRLAANLRPASLDQLGLVAALRQLVTGISGSSGARIQLAAPGLDAERLPWRIETDLFRIAQEALTNAVRHAQASEIGVLLSRRDGHVCLVVEDDGRGFDPDAVRESGRLGLLGMRERVETFGGTFHVESAPGSGTTIVVEAPENA